MAQIQYLGEQPGGTPLSDETLQTLTSPKYYSNWVFLCPTLGALGGQSGGAVS